MKLTHDTLNGSFTNVPQGFELAMRRAFAQIHQQEAQATPPRRYARRLSFGTVALIVLLLAAIAVAATLLTHNVFDITMGATPKNAAGITKYNLVKQSFSHCDIEVKEAAYDGMSLYIVYSIRDRNATELLGEVDEAGIRRPSDEGMIAMETAMAEDNIGWWRDNLWIDGKAVSMPAMSGGDTIAGEEPGELLFYMMYRLDQEKLYLNGTDVEIAMPIGENQPFESLAQSAETGQLEKPNDGLITFHLDCSIRSDVASTAPNVAVDLHDMTAKVSEAVYSPIQMYVTVDAQAKQDAMDAYIAKHGEGYVDEQGRMLWKYSGLDIIEPWVSILQLVDHEGKPVFDSMDGFYGYQGASKNQAWYTFPYMESYPDEMWLAPMDDKGMPDMATALKVK
ncbi:MAG: hypothetical protein RSI32_06225 [Clostridia bacterium]